MKCFLTWRGLSLETVFPEDKTDFASIAAQKLEVKVNMFRPWGGMGWLRLVGSLKSYVSFAEYRLFYRALLQKRHIILRSLLIVATPYSNMAAGRYSQTQRLNTTISSSLLVFLCQFDAILVYPGFVFP